MGFVLLATAVVVAIEYVRGRSLLLAESSQRLETESRLIADRIERALRDRMRLVAVWPGLDAAQDLAIDDLDKRLASSLVQLAASFGGDDVALAVDPAGRVIASSDRSWIGRNIGGELWLTAAVDDPPGGAALRIEPDTAGGWRVVTYSGVTAVADGRFLGCIALITGWRTILREADSRMARVVVRVEDAVLSRDPRLTGAGDLLQARGTTAPIGGIRFEVASAIPLSLALAPLHRTGRQIGTFALVVLLITVPGAVALARSTTGALRRLTEAALDMQRDGPPVFDRVPATAPREVRVLAESLQSMVERLDASKRELVRQESLAAMGTMAAALAHEIRTPLSIIRGSAEMLERGGAPGGRAAELAAFIIDEVERLGRLVDDLLVFARPREPVPGPTDLAGIAGRAARALESRVAQAGLRIDTSLEPSPLVADGEQLYQVVLNLLTNAVAASRAGGTIRVATRLTDDRVLLEVRDEGAGIPADVLDRVWTPFFTTRGSGTGLGLPIVRRIVEAHGGAIIVESEPGRGTQVEVSLPTVTKSP